jgi:hypothetical protein
MPLPIPLLHPLHAPLPLPQVALGAVTATGGTPTTSFKAGVASVPGTNGFTDITVTQPGAVSGTLWWTLKPDATTAETGKTVTAAFSAGSLTIAAADLGARTYTSIGSKAATLQLYTADDGSSAIFTLTITHTVRTAHSGSGGCGARDEGEPEGGRQAPARRHSFWPATDAVAGLPSRLYGAPESNHAAHRASAPLRHAH